MPVGASNNIQTALSKWLVGNVPAMFCVSSLRSSINREMAKGKFFDNNPVVKLTAEKAKQYGCGNCGEQSALAFFYLRGRGIEPLDWAHFTNRDHAFVLLGRPGNANRENMQEWLGQVVVCDPYYGRVGRLKDLPEYDIYKIGVMLHHEKGVTLPPPGA